VKIALFLGAGASVVYEKPTTKEFKKRLADKNYGNAEVDSILSSFLNLNDFLDVEYILKSIDDLIEFSTTFGGQYLSHLENESEGRSRIYHFHNGMHSEYKNFIENLKLLKENLENEVFQQYSWNHEKDNLLNKIFEPIIGQLDAMNNTIKIFTTNYDQAIEVFCGQKNNFHCNDGFKLDDSARHFLWNDGNYDEIDVEGKINFQLYKLHGSLTWKNHINYGIERTTFERKLNDPNYDKDFLIYPSLSPKDGVVDQPYATIRKKFKDFLLESDVCIVIGFSFRDDHLNDIFKEFLSIGKKLITISPSSFENIKKLFEQPLLYNETENEFNLKSHNVVGLKKEVSEQTIQQVTDFIKRELKK